MNSLCGGLLVNNLTNILATIWITWTRLWLKVSVIMGHAKGVLLDLVYGYDHIIRFWKIIHVQIIHEVNYIMTILNLHLNF